VRVSNQRAPNQFSFLSGRDGKLEPNPPILSIIENRV
jgi:hypothetical protein